MFLHCNDNLTFQLHVDTLILRLHVTGTRHIKSGAWQQH